MKNFNYRVVNDNELAITAYTGDDIIVNIPSEIDGKPVTSIESWAFSRCTSLIYVKIPNSVTSIGYYAFGGCTSLTDINVDNNNANYSSMDGVLFNKDKTKLICYPKGKTNTSYTIPNSVTSIGDFAFSCCTSLTSIEIPNSVISIGNSAFRNCTSLTNVKIPNSVTSVGDAAFMGCTSLTSINVDSNNADYSSMDGVLFNKDKTKLIYYPAGKTNTSYTIPDSVTNIRDFAFWDCTSLTSVEISNSVTSIGNSAFRNCTSLTNVKISNSVTSIGDAAFMGCTSLTSVEIPDSVTSIGFWAFGGCTRLTR